MTTFEQQFDKAWKIITPVGKTTITYLQLKMGIGFNRGAKIIDEMEKRGIIGPLTNLTPHKLLKKYES
jgi:DNA segregation ATPase FtsK/SpoIIIE, S-DNA-T family